MSVRISIVLIALAATLATPFLLRPKAEKLSAGQAERLVIISPHNETIRKEFERAFVRHMRENHQRKVWIDWRQPGGTSEIAMFLKSEFSNASENLWRHEKRCPLSSSRTLAVFANSKIVPDGTPDDSQTKEMVGFQEYDHLLHPDAGIGIDLFFGGGAFDFDRQANAGFLVSRDATGKYGPAALRDEHPNWFTDDAIAASVSGEPFYDPDLRWVGTVLSTFGICYNTDVIERLGIESPPETWTDLTDPRFIGQIALADPTKSGSATKAFEMIIQQQMRIALEERQQDKAEVSETIEQEAIREGWNRAMRLILKISANGRYFTDSSSKVPHDVGSGDAAAGMCIDFYGRTHNERFRKTDGSSRMHFVMPVGGTSIGADPIGLLRGAPRPELAHRFIEFVLSIKGQKIWDFRAGAPGGPESVSLRRLPVRRDFYTPENLAHMADAAADPFEATRGFHYEPAWSGSLFSPLRFIIRCVCVDTHPEQRAAWKALIDSRFSKEALAEFEDVSPIDYDTALNEIRPTLKSKDKIQEVELARQLSGIFREKYRRVRELCLQQ